MGAEFLEVVFAEFLEVEEGFVGAGGGAEEFVEFDLDGGAVAVLGGLDEEDHQKRNDGGAGVDDQLPGAVEPENRSTHGPEENNAQRGTGSDRVTCHP